ncbi:putative glycolipid-binding domain-containing protein [Leptolyngbya boryana CZ1]|uniref:Glycolipid-binding domain-containing protein n=1 Tax=Leptolyngbya boryana CZ1 TaxID=3060204 RepID=A0AA96WNL2_LEPBY|nr:putative glycolipid-binding domain-containing protein [Leptolyngbya boryana]WNZ43212.1 putative glycolipid-binding domain-containing protein [Leptolyngbya boryana CZ1]
MNSLEYTILWRRLDCPGHDSCCLWKSGDGWQLSGTAIFLFEQQPCLLSYEVNTDSNWETRTANISGYIGKSIIALTITRTPNNRWSINDKELQNAADCIDLDLGFTPATNLIAIRRLALAVGARSPAPAAWLDFPDFMLKRLEQHYHRLSHDSYKYTSPDAGYANVLEVDDYGAITRYPQLWAQEI